MQRPLSQSDRGWGGPPYLSERMQSIVGSLQIAASLGRLVTLDIDALSEALRTRGLRVTAARVAVYRPAAS